jgi:hypothetical protein
MTELLGDFRDFLKVYKEDAFKTEKVVRYLISTVFLGRLVWV